MDQRTHAWIAIRAVALLEQEGKVPNLVRLLKPSLKAAAIGSWIPDLRDAKIGGADTDNHVLKMKPYTGPQVERFTVKKQELLRKLGDRRRISAFISRDTTLDLDWWDTPYKAEPQPGQHIADRAGALATTITDLLIMGEQDLLRLLPRDVSLPEKLDCSARTRREKAALYFFMQSHFVADASMPCHCDARKLSSYDNGLHKEMERHWSKRVGTYCEKKKLERSEDTPEKVLEASREVDSRFGLSFEGVVPQLSQRDVWLEMVYVCRASFALASIVAPPSLFPYGEDKLASFKEILKATPSLIKEVDEVAMHDAVLNVAIVWKHIWERLS